MQKVVGGAAIVAHVLGASLAYNGLGELLSGRGPEDDETWSGWLLRKVLLGPLTTIPFVGAIEAAFTGKRASVRQDPLTGLGSDIVVLIQRLAQAAEDGDEEKLAQALEFFLPYQVRRTGKYSKRLLEGEDPSSTGEVFGGLIYGDRPGQPANVFTTDKVKKE